MKSNAVKTLFFKREAPKPPRGLSKEAKNFWVSLSKEYGIDDAAGLKLLGRVCESLDRMRGAQKHTKKDGEIVDDKKGSIKAHPAVQIEKEAHRQLLESLKMLNLDLEPLREKPGRPGGR